MNKSLWKNIIIEYNENKNLLYQQFLLMKSIQSGMGDEVARCIIELHKNGCNGSDDVRLRLPHMVEESNGIHPSPDSNPDDVRLRNPTTRVSGFQPSDVRLTSPAPSCILHRLLYRIRSFGVQLCNMRLRLPCIVVVV